MRISRRRTKCYKRHNRNLTLNQLREKLKYDKEVQVSVVDMPFELSELCILWHKKYPLCVSFYSSYKDNKTPFTNKRLHHVVKYIKKKWRR